MSYLGMGDTAAKKSKEVIGTESGWRRAGVVCGTEHTGWRPGSASSLLTLGVFNAVHVLIHSLFLFGFMLHTCVYA